MKDILLKNIKNKKNKKLKNYKSGNNLMKCCKK